MTVLVKIVRCGVVRNDKVDPAIVVHINKYGREAIETAWIGNTSSCAGVRERTIPIVVKQMIALAGESPRSEKNFNTAESASVCRKCPFPWPMVGVVFHISRNEEIKQSIMIVVAPRGASRPAPNSDTCLFGHICKCSVVIVVVEPVLSKIRDINVGPAVVVVVTNRHAKSPPLVGNARFVRDVCKCPIPIIVKKHRFWSGLLAGEGGHGRAIQNVYVEPSVIVVIEQPNSRARSLDDGIFFRTTGAVTKFGEPRLLSDINKYNRSAIDKTSGGDRT